MTQPASIRTATVASVNGTQVVLNVAGGQTTVGKLADYLPLVGDVVMIAADDQGRWTALGRTVGAGNDDGWHGVAYANGWHDRGAGFPPLSYRRTGDGLQVSGQAVGGTLTDLTVAFTLPAGYHAPTEHVVHNGQGGSLIFDAAGTVRVFGLAGNTAIQGDWTIAIDF